MVSVCVLNVTLDFTALSRFGPENESSKHRLIDHFGMTVGLTGYVCSGRLWGITHKIFLCFDVGRQLPFHYKIIPTSHLSPQKRQYRSYPETVNLAFIGILL